MALVSKSIPNLINGISQQPPALRLETQGEVQENGLSDVVDGLKKRPPTQFIKTLMKTTSAWTTSSASELTLGNLTSNNTTALTESELNNCFTHTYKRSEDEQFTVLVITGTTAKILVYDIGGNLRYESNKSSWDKYGYNIRWYYSDADYTSNTNAQFRNTDSTSYLGQLSANAMTATSVADATFLVNKNITVGMSDERNPPAFGNSALIYLKSVNYGRRYSLSLDSKTPNSTEPPVTGYADTNNATTGTSSGTTNNNDLKVSTTLNILRTRILTSSTATGTDASYSSTQTFASALSNDFINGRLTLQTLTINDATYNADQARLVVTLGDVTIPFNASGIGGWKYASAASTNRQIILPPEYVPQRLNTELMQYYYTRALVSVFELEAGAQKDITIQPTSYASEPYFVINSTPGGRIDDFTLTATDDDGGTNLRAFKDNAKSFTDLPNQCVDGYKLGVIGDNNKKEDDFHVIFEGSGGSGYWKETVKGGLKNSYNLATMPHQLRQGSQLQFSFGQGTWDSRVAGDDATNPAPSFVGNTISDVFFHRNRLGVLSDENVIFSEASSYYNFWRTTVRTLLDADPIDVAVSQNEVSELKAAVPIQDNLLLFSELNQFTLSASQLLTPSEVTIDQSTKYECDLTATPVGVGNSVFFATKSGDFSGLREFYTDGDTELKKASSITAHVPKYLRGVIRKLASSSNEDILIALTETNKKECYVYKWYDSGQERLQSAWSKWTFKEDIIDVSFNNATAYFTFNDGSYQKLLLRDDPTVITYTVGSATATATRLDALLDSRMLLQKTSSSSAMYPGLVTSLYPPLSSTTVFTNHAGAIIATGNSTAELTKVAAYLNLSHVENGSTVLNYVFAGEPYTFKYQLSEQVFKPVKGDSTEMARFQLRNMNFNYNDTATFTVTVENLGRDTKTTKFTGRILGQANNILGLAPIVDTGGFKVGVQSQAKNTKITLTNDTHLPSLFQSVEWEGFVNLRNQRL
tara:strand:- start:251 stop:3202 length:2952 start_codon:yes stop_codon:yes gene_type:complete